MVLFRPQMSSTPSLAALLRRLSEVSVVRFGLVGVSNTLISFAAFRVGLRALPAFYAQGFSYTVGMLWSYYWNRRWTFKSQSNLAAEAARFFSLQIGFLVLSASLLGLAEREHLNLSVSWLCTAVFVTVLNFVASRFWAFKPA